MFRPMSSPLKTANVLTRPAALGRLSSARRRNRCCTHRFHQCLGLLKKRTLKTPPARPISTSIYASKSASISTSIYTTICATTSAEHMFPSSVERPFPRPGQVQNRALPPLRCLDFGKVKSLQAPHPQGEHHISSHSTSVLRCPVSWKYAATSFNKSNLIQ